ncbi:MAG: PQQ-dependent sugar dehydrogenase, partial [Calditrichaeota bacterium]|nr:PQQ-dependent sugar dehydrogenase [Calditrichota bacterium]
AFVNGDLYVANINRIIKYSAIESNLKNPGYTVVYDQLPSDSWHGYKVLRQGPDQKLYIPLGAPCNICDSTNTGLNLKYGSMNRLNTDGSGFETIATGIRNSVGFDWNPSSNELWFTDNGRDNLGNGIPPDELNRIPEIGKHFGFPFVHGDSIMDPSFGGQGIPANFMPPVFGFDAHSASLGMRFYTGGSFPSSYHKQVFVAHHGSWNRTPPIGYRIVVIHLNGNEAVSQEIFAEGWLQGNGGIQSLGRPVDVEILSDGSMLVSDDLKGNIFRIWYDPD